MAVAWPDAGQTSLGDSRHSMARNERDLLSVGRAQDRARRGFVAYFLRLGVLRGGLQSRKPALGRYRRRDFGRSYRAQSETHPRPAGYSGPTEHDPPAFDSPAPGSARTRAKADAL